VIDPEVAKRAAISFALDDIGLALGDDEEIVEDFIAALKERGYVVVRAVDTER
jgi:hypothetical protein